MMGDEAQRLHCPAEVAALVPHALARQHEFFPLEYAEGVITIAVAAPLTYDVLDNLSFVLDREIREVLHSAELIRRSLDELYGEWVGREESIYYWREWRNIEPDGTIVIKARGYDQFNTHWTGCVEIKPDDPDFGLWTWILAREHRFETIISGERLETIRAEYLGSN